MFFRKITTRSNDKEYTYVKLIENYRKGSKVKQRVVANLGNVEDLNPPRVHNLIVSLSKVCGVELPIKAKPKAKRILRFGDILLIHKVWDKLDLSRAIGSLKNTAPDTALALELLVINRLLNIPRGALNEWRRHLYLPVRESAPPLNFEEALDCLAKIKEDLEIHILNRMREWGIINTSQIYCFLMEGFLENNDTGTQHFLSPPPERRPFEIGIFATREGMPVGGRVFLKNHNDHQNMLERIIRAQEQDKKLKCVFVGNALYFNGHNEQEYITGLPASTATAQQFYPHGLLTDPADTFYQLHEDLWYKEIKEAGVRYLLCFNPLLAARKQQELENHLTDENDLEKQAACYGRFLIITNSQTLSGEEIIRAYNNFVTFKECYRTIKSPFLTCESAVNEQTLKGQIFICLLAQLIERLLEHILHEQGINISAAAALQILEPVRITINEMAGEIIPSTITMDKTQRKILSALDAGAATFDTTDFQPSVLSQPASQEEDLYDVSYT